MNARLDQIFFFDVQKNESEARDFAGSLTSREAINDWTCVF